MLNMIDLTHFNRYFDLLIDNDRGHIMRHRVRYLVALLGLHLDDTVLSGLIRRMKLPLMVHIIDARRVVDLYRFRICDAPTKDPRIKSINFESETVHRDKIGVVYHNRGKNILLTWRESKIFELLLAEDKNLQFPVGC